MNSKTQSENTNKRFVCYVVFRGRKTGVFKKWNKVKPQIMDFKNAYYRGFYSKSAAKRALANFKVWEKKNRVS